MRYLYFTTALLLTACVTPVDTSDKPGQVSLLDEHTIRFMGDTSEANVTAFKNLLAKSTGIKKLIISSPGGDVNAGIELGKMVYQHRLNVIVRKVCASSCANYVVTASKDAFVEKEAILGWHGGAFQSLYTPLSLAWFNRIKWLLSAKKQTQQHQWLRLWQEQETQFFKFIGVEQAVTILAMMPNQATQRDAALFSYDPATLKRLGLKIKFEHLPQAVHTQTGEKMVQIYHYSEDELGRLLASHTHNLANQDLIRQF
ncbi:hypothetical protein [Aliiglaciecola sp. LCG003]|uniref:hypothetical protein n=1 Tax=Aliiglaciecola sp. LCG003 TaxID=3053655 RepID=UPI002572F701|nr:hypothetical protein [Aliiglaciecola sp. LCG003]WJG10136.1 hypothetical protein QR722_03600 [Aliiglaciecola sp. LCG003]